MIAAQVIEIMRWMESGGVQMRMNVARIQKKMQKGMVVVEICVGEKDLMIR